MGEKSQPKRTGLTAKTSVPKNAPDSLPGEASEMNRPRCPNELPCSYRFEGHCCHSAVQDVDHCGGFTVFTLAAPGHRPSGRAFLFPSGRQPGFDLGENDRGPQVLRVAERAAV